MNVLVLQFVVLSFLALFFSASKIAAQKYSKYFCVLSFLSMWYIHSMGEYLSVPDLDGYFMKFMDVSHYSINQILNDFVEGNVEKGYLLFNKLIASVGLDFRAFLVIYSFILLALYFNGFKKYSPYLIISILFLLINGYNQSIFVIRQHLAIAIFVASFPLIIERKFWLFLLVSILMFSIHRTSIVCFPIYFLYALKKKSLIGVFVLLTAILYVTFSMALYRFSSYFWGYDGYLSYGREGANATGFIIMLVMFLTYLIILRENVFVDGINRLIFIVLSLSVAMTLGGIGFTPTGRLSLYYEVAPIFALPIAMKYAKNMTIRTMILLGIMGLWFYKTFIGNAAIYIKDFTLISII